MQNKINNQVKNNFNLLYSNSDRPKLMCWSNKNHINLSLLLTSDNRK